jgi:hypothetical protein
MSKVVGGTEEASNNAMQCQEGDDAYDQKH